MSSGSVAAAVAAPEGVATAGRGAGEATGPLVPEWQAAASAHATETISRRGRVRV